MPTVNSNELEVAKFAHTWTIKNFLCCTMEAGEVLESATFGLRAKQHPKWYLRLYPRGIRDPYSRGHMSLFLRLSQGDIVTEETFIAKYKCSILNAAGEQNAKMLAKQKFRDGEGYGWPRFVQCDTVLNKDNGLLPGDQLSIFCEVSLLVDPTKAADGGHFTTQCPVPKCRLNDDFGVLLENCLFADCVLFSGGKEFKVGFLNVILDY